jgi:hypothetical protein
LDGPAREALQLRIRDFANRNNYSASQKDDIARNLASQCGVDYDDIRDKRLYYLMNPAELADLDPALIDIQLHTHRHRSPLSRTRLAAEISDNRESLHAMLGPERALHHFCYPSGVHARQMLPWLSEYGIESATTCVPGLASPDSPPLLLPRFIDTEDVPDAVFDGWVSGFCSWLPQRSGNVADVTAELENGERATRPIRRLEPRP